MTLVQTTVTARKAALATNKPIRVAFYLQQGVEVLDFAGPMEVFSNAGFEVFTVSATKEPVISQGILKVLPDYSITNAPQADIVAFFGGNAGTASRDSNLITWVQQRKASTRYFFSVCTGAFILGRSGILDGLTVTTFHLSIDDLVAAVPKAKVLRHVRFVDNGKVITTAGISAGIDGALHLVSVLKGEEVAAAVAKYMEYDKWVAKDGLILPDGPATAGGQ
ncbi:class I glutamine amidotransferase-like protein [Russula earlei]|uniref:Class I glutamine amidotransferase-like protein n=1 Tax=Russula earlei TaxID=71964 RepID=A0ACC0TRQ9_9AGAM|nr:class I glutamine amidotransferase-like protein [Russula earlei]